MMDEASKDIFLDFGSDPAYFEAGRKGPADIEKYFESKVRYAEATGDERFVFRALYCWMSHSPTVRLDRDTYLAAARRLLTLAAPDVQLPLYVAQHLFAEFDEPGLALDLIEHGYTVVKDAETAFHEMIYLRESLKLKLAIQAALDPWSDETRTSLFNVAFVCGLSGEFNSELIEAMETIVSRPADDWLEARMQRSILQALWSRYAADRHFAQDNGSDRLARVEELIGKVRDLPMPDLSNSPPL